MLTRNYVIRELNRDGLMTRPVANNWSEGAPGEHLFGNEYEDELYDTREEAEQAIYDFFFGLWKKEKGQLYVKPCYTVIEMFGFEGE